jgi:hypothetical protein
MSTTIVRYQTKPDRADENQALIERVFAELATTRPEGLRYVSFRLADGVSFVHVASVDTVDGANPLNQTTAFGEFVAEIGDRCEVPPVALGAEVVGAFGFAESAERARP